MTNEDIKNMIKEKPPIGWVRFNGCGYTPDGYVCYWNRKSYFGKVDENGVYHKSEREICFVKRENCMKKVNSVNATELPDGKVALLINGEVIYMINNLENELPHEYTSRIYREFVEAALDQGYDILGLENK